MDFDRFLDGMMVYVMVLMVVVVTVIISAYAISFARGVVDPAHDNLYCQNRSFGAVCITPMPESR